MKLEYYNGHLINGFAHAAQARKVIKRYRALRTKHFSDVQSSLESIYNYEPKLLRPSSAASFIDDNTVSHESVLVFLKYQNFRKLKKLSDKDGKTYIVGNTASEVISELGMAITSCIYLYTLMIAYDNDKTKVSGCSDLYPEKDTVPGWLSVLVGINHNKSCHMTLEIYFEMFIATAADRCYDDLDNGRNFLESIEVMLDNVGAKIDKRFPDFADVTVELVEACKFLAKTTVLNNTYYIETGR